MSQPEHIFWCLMYVDIQDTTKYQYLHILVTVEIMV